MLQTRLLQSVAASRSSVEQQPEWEGYVRERKAKGEDEVLGLLKKYVASAKGDDGEQDPDMLAIGTGAQKFANNEKPKDEA